MAIEIREELSLNNDSYEEYVKDTKKQNNLLILDVKTYQKFYSSKFILDNSAIYADKSEKENIIENAIKETEKEIGNYLEKKQKEFNEKLHELKTKMSENYLTHTEEEIRYDKEVCLRELKHLEEGNIKDIINISSSNLYKAGEELKAIATNVNLEYDARRAVDIGINNTIENVSSKLKEHQKNYITPSEEYGEAVIEETARNLLKVKAKDEETKAKEYKEKKSQEFNINTGDEKRYDDYVDINQNNKPLNDDDKKREEQLNYIFGIYNINIKVENGVIVGKDSNNEELRVEYDTSIPSITNINLTDSRGNKYFYTENDRGCSIDAKYADNINEEVYPVFTTFEKEKNNFKISLSNGQDMYVYLSDKKVKIYDEFLTSKEFTIGDECKNIKDVINTYKNVVVTEKQR